MVSLQLLMMMSVVVVAVVVDCEVSAAPSPPSRGKNPVQNSSMMIDINKPPNNDVVL